MDITQEAKQLKDNRLLKSEAEIKQFEQAIANILSMKDVNHIRYLCMGFDDSTNHDEVTFGLIHAIESYDKDFGTETSLKKFGEALPSLFPQAKEWAKIFHKRILNHEPSRKIYAQVISGIDQQIKSKVIELIKEIRDGNPKRFNVPASDFLSDLTNS